MIKYSLSSIQRDIENLKAGTKAGPPVLVMAHYRSDLCKWIVAETYQNTKDKYTQKSYEFDNLLCYHLPEGFTGSCIIDDIDIPDGMEDIVAAFLEDQPPRNCDYVYRDYG